jgi:uncharacterized membrane protein
MKWVHILAGLAGIASGAVALYAAKGAGLHRKAGMVFVYTMLVMSASGAVMAALKHQTGSVIAGVLTFYLVLTGLVTVRRPALEFHGVDAVAMLVALAVGIAGFKFGSEALAADAATKAASPPVAYFVFGTVALLAALGDLRILLAPRSHAAARMARHLWRMCFALFVATGSFFLGQPRLFPKALRSSGVLALPVLWVLLAMFYWLARVWLRRRPLSLDHSFHSNVRRTV